MKAQFLKAKRQSENSVIATYKDIKNGTEFTVEWNNIHPGTGEIGSYDLQVWVECTDKDLQSRIINCIKVGESDSNEDLQLYYDLRDTFDASDCEDFEVETFKVLIHSL